MRADRAARSSPSPTRTRRGRRMRCGSSSRNFADPDVAYVCGQLRLERRGRRQPRGRLLALRDVAARERVALGSVTGGNGSIYAVRRADYVDVDPRFGHDLSFPYLMVQHGRRAVYEPGGGRVREADADERGRVPAQGAHVRALLADRRPRADAPPPAARLPRRARLAPASSLRQRAAPSASCSGTNIALVARVRVDLLGRARRATRVPRGGPGRRRPRALLRPRHVGHGRLALALRSARRARRCGRRPRARDETAHSMSSARPSGSC